MKVASRRTCERDRELNERDIMILASFVFYPLGRAQGRRGRDIARVCLPEFMRLFRAPYPKRIHANLYPWTTAITMRCRRLVRLGYLLEVGTEPATAMVFRKDSWEKKEWDSPTFAPSESGMVFALSNFDHQLLPLLSRAHLLFTTRSSPSDLANRYKREIEVFRKYVGHQRQR